MRYLLYTIIIGVAALIIAAIVVMLTNEWAWHPLGQCTPASTNPVIAHHEIVRCKSYNWYSGFGANFGELTLFTLAVGAIATLWRTYRRFECDVEEPTNCHRLGHPVPGTSHYACREHHPHGIPRHSGITVDDLLKQHEEANHE